MNPYSEKSKIAFWSNSVARADDEAIFSQIYQKKFHISPEDKICSAGSCFAQHISRKLKENGFNFIDYEPAPWGLFSIADQAKFGYGLYSARFGNIYSVRSLLQLAEEAYGEWVPNEPAWKLNNKFTDPFRPNIEPNGYDSELSLLEDRKYHLARVRLMLESFDIFIFTLGLTEAWMSLDEHDCYAIAPGVIGGEYDPTKYKLKNFSVAEVVEDFEKFIELINQKRPEAKSAKFILTVSPVPLTATATNNHVITATTYSKAVLRAAAGELSSRYENIDYFPSFELISSPWMEARHYETNKRGVRSLSVDRVMKTFFDQHINKGEEKKHPKQGESLATEVCEDFLLDAFSKT